MNDVKITSDGKQPAEGVIFGAAIGGESIYLISGRSRTSINE